MLADKATEEPPALSIEDQEIKQLGDRRKELRKKEDMSQREKIEHTELHKKKQKKERKKKRNADKDCERNGQITLTLHFKEDQSIYTKEDQRKGYVI